MNILHLSTFERFGAGIAAGRLHRSLRELGHVSTMLVRDRAPGLASNGVVSLDATCRTLSNPLLDRFLLTALKAGRAPGVDYYFSTDRSTRDIASLEVVRDADVINLHWVAEMVSAPALRAIQDLGKPVVWTLHDQFPFTGGCHYSGACEQYTSGCHACPHVRADIRRIPELVMAQKREWMDATRLTAIAPSEWLATCARRSLLLRDADIRVIPNAVPVGDYQRVTQQEARARLGLPSGAVILLFGADSLGETRKGFAHLMQALRQLSSDPAFAGRIANRSVLCVTFGESRDDHADADLPVRRLGRLSSDDQLAAAYSAADLFILPTLEDNLPNTLLESVSAGTPVVAYASGGVPDVLRDGHCGVLVPSGDHEALGRAIGALIDDPAARATMRQSCAEYARAHLDLPIQGRKYLDVYGALLDASRTPRRQEQTTLTVTRFARQEQRLLSRLLEDPALVAAPFKAFQAELDQQKAAIGAAGAGATTPPSIADLADLETRFTTLKNLDADLSRRTAGSEVDLARALAGTRDPLEWLLTAKAGRPVPHVPAGDGTPGVVSVIIPVYNAARYLEAAVRSVWTQTLAADQIEIVVIDDGSTDGSYELACALQSQSPQRMQVLRHPKGANRGVSATRNVGLAHAHGEFIALLDADDAYEPERLSAGLRYLQRHRECDTLCSFGVYMDERGREIAGPNGTSIAGDYRSLSDRLAPPFTFNQLWELYPIANSSLLIRRTALAAAGAYADEMAHQAEDRLLVLKLSLASPVHLLRKRLIRYRHHAASFTAQYVEHGFEPGVQLELLYHLVYWMVLQEPRWRERGVALFRRHFPVLLARASRARRPADEVATCVCNQTGMDAQSFLVTRQRELAELEALRRAVPAALRDARNARSEVVRLRTELRRLRQPDLRVAKSA